MLVQTYCMAIHEAWLFEDDSLLVLFDNGCRLQLSPCGAVFRCFSPIANAKNSSVRPSKETQQCSQFATTMWKDMVKQAVDFRNKFASYPYLCYNLSEITTAAKQHEVVSSTSCTWSADDFGEHHDDGSISIISKEKNATVILSPCKQSFIVDFLCKIRTEKQNESERPSYSWVNQIHSINLPYPHCFDYPMSLLSAGTMAEKNVKPTGSVVSDLPQSLPQQCKKHHLHRWRSHWNDEKLGACKFLDGKLFKVFYSDNVFYRFYYDKYVIGEVTLSDGSVLRSTGPTHLYFKHWIYDVKSENVIENVYSTKAPPLNDRTSPVAKILNKVCRYLQYLSVCWKTQTVTLDCCWKNGSDSQPVDVETELEFSTYIPDHGSFKTYSNGRVRIAFCDGAIMNFYDLNGGKCKTPSRDDESCCGKSSKKLRTALDDGFSLILPNGISLKASFDSHAEPYNRYVKTALDFIKWKKNYDIEKEVQLDDKNSNQVYEELEKLRRFTDTAVSGNTKKGYIFHCAETDHESDEMKIGESKISNTFHREARLAVPPLSEVRNMEEYLNDTRKAVDEIDVILQNCKRQLGKK